MKRRYVRGPAITRLLSWVEIDPETECWIWTGAASSGYGRMTVDGRTRLSHVVSYEALVGPIPPGLELDHLCRVRRCANPDHLEPVTRRENTLRGDSIAARFAARSSCAHGHPYDEANTRTSPRGRECRACGREKMRRRREAGRALSAL